MRRHSSRAPRVAPQPHIRSHLPCVIKPYRFPALVLDLARRSPRERLPSRAALLRAPSRVQIRARGARALAPAVHILRPPPPIVPQRARPHSCAMCRAVWQPLCGHSQHSQTAHRPRRHLPCLSRAYVYPSTWRRNGVGLHSWHSSVEPTVQLAPHQSLHSSTPSYPAQPLLTLLTLRSESIPHAHGGSNHHTLLTRREKFSPIRIGRSEGTTTAGRSSSFALPAPPSPAPSSSAGAGASSSFASFFGSG